MQKQSILISGIGIAGSTLAYWLGEHGFQPTLVEKAPHLRTGGYVIDFWGLGFEIAERMGLRSDLKANGYDVEELRLVDAKGRRIGGFGVNVFRELTEGRYVSLPRSDLAKLIYHKLDNRFETIFGDTITEIKQDGEGVRVAFEHAPARRFDLVIGADGLHSAVRQLAFGNEDRFEKYLGYTVAAFEVEGYRPRDELVYVSYNAPGKQVARFALRDDRTLFLLVFATDQITRLDAHDREAQKASLHAEFDGIGWECPKILSALDACDELYFDRVSQIRMDTWISGRVALVGDAACCPSLLAGQGSALAIIGAYVLAGEIGKNAEHPERGLQNYQQLLYPFMTGKQDSAAQFAGTFAPKTKFWIFLRNQITKTFKIPGVAKLVLGSALLDQIELPDYPTQAEGKPWNAMDPNAEPKH